MSQFLHDRGCKAGGVRNPRNKDNKICGSCSHWLAHGSVSSLQTSQYLFKLKVISTHKYTIPPRHRQVLWSIRYQGPDMSRRGHRGGESAGNQIAGLMIFCRRNGAGRLWDHRNENRALSKFSQAGPAPPPSSDYSRSRPAVPRTATPIRTMCGWEVRSKFEFDCIHAKIAALSFPSSCLLRPGIYHTLDGFLDFPVYVPRGSGEVHGAYKISSRQVPTAIPFAPQRTITLTAQHSS